MKPLAQRHELEVKLRLTQKHYDLLRALARMRDLPLAVLARQMVVAHIERWTSSDSVPAVSRDGSPQTSPRR
jgi:hypothetical protein